jgi:putative MATE family efflux protein
MAGTAAQRDKFIKMTTQPVGRLVTGLAIPSIVSMLISGIYNLVDTFFIGQINTPSVAALGIVFSYMALIQAVSMFFGQGAGNFISRALGRESAEEAEVMASVGLISSMGTGALMAVIGFIFMNPILRFFGSTETILPYASDYFTWILAGAPFIMGCFTMNNLMRHQGNALLSMIGIATGAVLNVALDPIFIFLFGLGIKGAGIATAISQFIGFFVMLALSGFRGGIPIRLNHFKPSLHLYREIAAGGLPSLARQGLLSVAAICLNQMASRYGDAAVASFSVVNRVTMLASAAMIGYGQGFQPVCGFNYGAGKFDRVRSAFRHSCIVSTIYCTALAALGFVFAKGIVSVFRDDPDVIRIGSEVLRYQCISFPLTGIVVMANMFLQNIRKTWPAVIMASARQGIFFLPALIVGHLVLGFLGVEIAQAVADALSFILALPLCIYFLERLGRK